MRPATNGTGAPARRSHRPQPYDLVIPVVAIAAFAAAVLVVAAFVLAAAMLTVALALAMAMTRRVLIGVPVVLHEEHAAAAGVIFRAMPAPVLLVAGRNVQVDRRLVHEFRRLRDYHRAGVDYRWRLRVVADRDLAVEAGLVDADRDADVVGERRGRDSDQ